MSIRKLFILAADAIFSFSRFPIRFCLILGSIGALVFMGAGIYVLIAKAYGFAVIGWSSTFSVYIFLVPFNWFSWEYLVNMFTETIKNLKTGLIFCQKIL